MEIVKLDQEHLSFVQKEINNGGKFCESLLSCLSLEEGELKTILPKGINVPSDLSDGLIWPHSFSFSHALKKQFASYIFNYLQGKHNYAVVEAVRLQRNQEPVLTFTYKQRLYYYLKEYSSINSVFTLMNACIPYVDNIIILTSLKEHNEPVEPMQEITPEQYEALVNRTAQVIVQAFDNEGYIIWKRI